MIAIVMITFIILFSVYSRDCIPMTVSAVDQVIFSLIPAIFPFYVAAEILIRKGYVTTLSGSCSPIMRPVFKIDGAGAAALILGILCGYPCGAKVTADLYKLGHLTKKEASNLCSFTNNAGPLYLIGAVGTGLLDSPKKGLMLWLIHVSAALISGLLICNISHFLSKKDRNGDVTDSNYNIVDKSSNLPEVITDSILAATRTMLSIAGNVIFFAAFTSVLWNSGILFILPGLLAKYIEPSIIAGLSWGFFEISGGISRIISATVSCSPSFSLALLALIAGWGGISVHIQVIGILRKSGIPAGKFIVGKILHSVIAAVITYIAAI